jgi:hypothetical protein
MPERKRGVAFGTMWKQRAARSLTYGLILVLIGAAGAISASARVRPNPGGNVVLGRVVGGIVFTGRAPSGTANRYQRGRVRVEQFGREVKQQIVKRNQRYHFRLLAGNRYTLIAHTKWGNCKAHATPRRNRTTQTNIYCLFHG